jgi:L-amino acid N-acyltransferase YncA
MKIRKAKKEDIRRIDEIYVDGSIRERKLQFPKVSIKEMRQDLNKYKKSRPKGFLKEMKSKNHYWIVAEEKEEIVGFGQAWIKTKEIGMLEKIYIDRRFARQGIGIKLLKELEKWLISKKVKFIESSIYYKNKPSIRLHEKAGYKPISIKMRKKVKY